MLLIGKSCFQKTHYDILYVREDATYEEIRASYRFALLNSHPDKLQRTTDTSGHVEKLQEKFLNIQKAWEILGDSKTRSLYDHELQASRQDAENAEDISFEEMVVEDGGEVLELLYQCRCGDYFAIDSTELEEMGYLLDRDGQKALLKSPDDLPTSIVLPCGSCSLKIRMVIDFNC